MPGVKEIHKGREYTAFNTRLGWMGILGTSKGISRLTLPHRNEKSAIEALSPAPSDARVDEKEFADAVSEIRDYFTGKRVEFASALDLSAGTHFQQKVWKACSTIGFGKTLSYGGLARKIGKPAAARAVGNAMNKNPIPIIIPCHRVVAADGSVGGYGGGLAVKKELLALEGVKLPD
jgi:methylated-DNA-[protein]-cysteine S-methyltransferase